MLQNITAYTKQIIKNRQKLALILITFLLLIGFVVLFSAAGSSKTIAVTIDQRKADQSKSYEKIVVDASLMSSVGDLFSAGKLPIGKDNYSANTDLNTMIKNIDRIVFTKKIKGIIQADGKNTEFESSAETVGDLLKENNIQLGDEDFSIPDVNVRLTDNINAIAVVRVRTEIVSSQRDKAFETEYVDNDEWDVDQEEIITPGVPGKEVAVEQVTYYDGEEFSRKTISTASVIEPVTQVVEKGTRTANGGNISNGNSTQPIDDQFAFICAVVAQEGGYSYDGALAVISCIMNRVDSGAWGGNDVISVITAPGQFEAYLSGAYLRRVGTDMPEVERAVTDCMQNGIRNTDCQSFRAAGYNGATGELHGGNVYF